MRLAKLTDSFAIILKSIPAWDIKKLKQPSASLKTVNSSKREQKNTADQSCRGKTGKFWELLFNTLNIQLDL